MEKTVRQTIASLGSPRWIERVDTTGGAGVVVARWQHESARIGVSAADAIRVVLGVGAAKEVRHAVAERQIATRPAPGQIGVFPAGVPSETTVDGDADTIQIFVEPKWDVRAAPRAPLAAPLAPASDELRRAALQLVVATRFHDRVAGRDAAGRWEHSARALLAAPLEEEHRIVAGGLPPIVVRRVEDLIAEAMEGSSAAASRVTSLANAARLSVNHFIRTFRKVSGTTPHQLVMTRRAERSVELLRRPGLSVADVADVAGYSSPAHFVASFRRTYGVTPGAFQRALDGPG